MHGSWAIFAQGDFKITDKLIATPSLRYNDEHKELDVTYSEIPPYPASSQFHTASIFQSDVNDITLDDSTVTGTAKLTSYWTPSIMTYASYGRGYKAGGTNVSRIPLAAASIQEIADTLNVDWLLTGSVRRAGDRVRVSVQLVDVGTEQTRWSRKFDGRIEDVFDLQDELTAEIAKALDIQLVSGEEGRYRLSRYSTPEAGEELYRGMYHHYAYDRASFEKALAHFDRFIELEPDSVIGHVWKVIAWGFAIVVQWGQPSVALPKLKAHADRVLELDPTDPHALIGQVYFLNLSGDPIAGALAAEQAVQVAPNLDEGWFMLSWCQMLCGRPEDGIVSMSRAIRLSPVVPATRLGVLATLYRNAGRYKESVEIFQSVIENYPDFVWGHIGLATTYGLSGDVDAAAREVKRALNMDPTYTVERFTVPDLYLDKSVMKASGDVLLKAGMPSASG